MIHFYTRLSFLSGVIIGCLLAIKLVQYTDEIHNTSEQNSGTYEKWFKKYNLSRKPALWDNLRYGPKKCKLESEFLYEQIKVLCIILVKNLKNIEAAKVTWANSCNTIEEVHLNNNGSTKSLFKKRTQDTSSWVLLCNTLTKIHKEQFHWVIIVNDSTFVILENLRYYLAQFNYHEPVYLGHAVSFWGTIYNSATAGYVLSKAALSSFQKSVENTKCVTNSYWNREDYYLGKALAALNISPIDTKDEHGLSLFHPYNWYHVFNPGENYYKLSVFNVKCCSTKSITFHAIDGAKMYTYHYLLYKLQIFLEGNLGNQPNFVNKTDDHEVWKKFLRERGISNKVVSAQRYYDLWEDLVHDPNTFASSMRKDQAFDYN